MTTPWQEYKKKLGTTRPWHMLDPNVPRVEDEESADRYAKCLACPSLIKTTKQCKECGCFMAMKVKLKNATCPLGKW
jgi:hypothetical protein